MKTAHHTTNTRERFMPNHVQVTDRMKRRAEQRKEERAMRKAAIRARMKANNRLVRF